MKLIGLLFTLLLGAGTLAGKEVAVLEGDINIHIFQGELRPGVKIYGRVDAERDGRVIRGMVWKFTVGR